MLNISKKSSHLLLIAVVLLNVFQAHPAESQNIVPGNAPAEIVVTAVEHYWIGSETARITARLEASAKSAREAQNTLQETSKLLSIAAAKLGAGEPQLRGENFLNAGDKHAPLDSGSSIHAERYLAFSLNDKPKVGALIDALLENGAREITEVEYLAPGESKAQEAALKRASELATIKATRIADSLGVRLGPLLLASSAEEPLGATLRKQLQQGIQIDRYSERDSNVYLTVRYQVLEETKGEN